MGLLGRSAAPLGSHPGGQAQQSERSPNAMQFATARRVFQSRTAIALRRAVLNDVDNASSVESLLTGNLAARRSRVLFSSSGAGGQFVCASVPPIPVDLPPHRRKRPAPV